MNESTTQSGSRVRAAKNATQGNVPVYEDFPLSGNVRPAQAAKYLSIGLSTLWLFIKQGRIQRPRKFSARVSTFPASYIRELADNGIPEADTREHDCSEGAK